MKPTVGRIVHYIDGAGECQAAIVTRVPAENASFVELTVFPPALGLLFVTAGHDETNKRRHMWHWPERES
jgi:hypothetical protein